IFLGYLCAIVFLALFGRLRSASQPVGWVQVVCWLLIGAMALDGLNAFFFDGSAPHLYPPTTVLRLATGLGCGFAVGLFALPVISQVAFGRAEEETVPPDVVELASGLALCAALGA